ncbi:MAG: OmpH family outer membrane protein [Cyclobacteriaceae bacterium]
MKNLSIAINVILAIALAVLYYLHFTSSPSAPARETGNAAQMGDIKMAFINSDTVLKYFEHFKTSREKLEAKQVKLNNEFRNRAQGLQREIASYQNTVGNLTIGQAKAVEEDLTKKEQNLRLYQESLAQELSNDQDKLNQELYASVTSYLKDYGNQNGIHAVFKFDPSSDLLFAGEVMDITQEVIAGLNESYKDGKKLAQDSLGVK